MYNIIKNMYKAPDIKIKIQGCLTDCIHTNIGVKQGCMLSPTLFNLYINDLPEIFDKNCEPPLLQDMPINSLLYADDLILLSQTQKGLQTSLNKLEEYCRKWKLEINTEKNKKINIHQQKTYDKNRLSLRKFHS